MVGKIKKHILTYHDTYIVKIQKSFYRIYEFYDGSMNIVWDTKARYNSKFKDLLMHSVPGNEFKVSCTIRDCSEEDNVIFTSDTFKIIRILKAEKVSK